MAKDARAYRNTLVVLWLVLSPIASIYSKQQNIPFGVAVWLAGALFVESVFYLAPGFKWSRGLVESIEPPAVRALMLTLTALLPYCVYALGTGTFHLKNFAVLAGIATVMCAWFVVLDGKRPIIDLLFVGLMVAVLLSKFFDQAYITLAPKASAGILGQLMLIRTGAFVVLTIRKMPGIGFGFLPTGRDWRIGVTAFAALMPAIWVLNLYVGAVAPRLAPGPWWRMALLGAGTFLAFLWVVALSEEFVFRGIIMQSLTRWTGTAAALILTSALFGLVHLPFRGFPNWKWVAIASLLGLFCGLAAMRAGSIRAAVVTHSLVVVTWRLFFA